MTLRILPELKEQFTRRSRQLGLSTCHVAEGLIKGWLTGIEEKVELVHQSPTINLHLTREVMRRRRYAVEEEVSESVDVEGSCEVCGRHAHALAFRKDQSKVLLCKLHLGMEKSKLCGWRVLNERVD